MGIFYNISVEGDDANGIKIIENPTKTLKALLFPREQLHEFNQRQEAEQAGVYILYNSMDRNEQPHIYIGQTGYGITSRLSNHNRTKNFWNQALVFVEKGDFLNLNSAHAKIIESRLISKAGECGAVVMENNTGSRAPRVQPSDQMAADTWAEEVVTITRLLGLAFFHGIGPHTTTSVHTPVPERLSEGIVPDGTYTIIRKKKADGRTVRVIAVVRNGEWIIQKDSVLGIAEQPRLLPSVRELRKKLKIDAQGVLLEDFNLGKVSPSSAGCVVLNQSCNGWTSWFTMDGKPIDIYRS